MAARKRRKTVTMRKKGKKPITFNKGGLHRTTHTPMGQPIPESKKRAALAGRYGPKGKQQASFAFKGALAKGRATRKKKARSSKRR